MNGLAKAEPDVGGLGVRCNLDCMTDSMTYWVVLAPNFGSIDVQLNTDTITGCFSADPGNENSIESAGRFDLRFYQWVPFVLFFRTSLAPPCPSLAGLDGRCP